VSGPNGTPLAARGILTLAMSGPEQADATLREVQPDWLTGPELRVFAAVARLRQHGHVASPVSVADELKATGDLDGVGGMASIAKLIDFDDADPRSLSTYAMTLRTEYQRRRLTELGIKVGNRDPDEVIAEIRENLNGLTASTPAGLPDPTPVLDLPHDKRPEWAVDRLIERGDINLIVGDGASYKTTFALHVAIAIACGGPVAGHFATTPGPVLYVSGEDGAGRIRNRVRAIARGLQLHPDNLNRLLIFARCGVTLDDLAWRSHLLAIVERTEAVAVFFDPLRDLTAANLNVDHDTAPLTRYARELCELPTEPAVVVNHHPGKIRDGQRKIDRVRGSSALNQAARSILFLTRRAGGVQIEHLKLTDAAPHPAFTIDTTITESEGKPGLWHTASFSFHSKREADRAEAIGFVREWIRAKPGATTTEVRNGVRKEHPKLTPSGISDAMNALHANGEASKGTQVSKREWRLL
jgi:hypothetical protein